MSIGTFCAVMAQVDAHDHALGVAQQHEDDLEARAAELFADDYSPELPENVGEALANLDGDNAQALIELFRENRYTEAGKLIEEMIEDYWLNVARERAEAEDAAGDQRDPREDQ